jgi:hypothetical protein
MSGSPTDMIEALHGFVTYASRLEGRERGEAQLFLERLFQSFGNAGIAEAGATLEKAVKRSDGSTRFADLVWKPRVLIEMKARGEKLERHYRQAFEYWIHLTPNRPRYVVLCNFDEFRIYDFDQQVEEPMDHVRIDELPERHTALAFLRPSDQRPLFKNDRVAVTREAADKVAAVFNALVSRGEDREKAQRFILQCVVALFSEDLGLLPDKLFTRLLADCREGESSFDLIGGLFRQMNNEARAPAGRYRDVPYFNGGLFATIDPLHLDWRDVHRLQEAASHNWSKVQPAIFGTLFQESMDAEARHAFGAHYTHEVDIQKVVLPTIVRPWREDIQNASSLKELLALAERLLHFNVLDPACGSGNFLYVAYRELRRIEVELLLKIRETAPKKHQIAMPGYVSLRQFWGFDVLPFAVELAKVTLLLAKELSVVELDGQLHAVQKELGVRRDSALPLDNLDKYIRCKDSLFEAWPLADAIIGNPPFQSKNKMQAELGRAYLNRLKRHFPEVPGRADYCVYFLRKTHDQLRENGRAGLVGTNTIRQNYSREGGLDYIVGNGGTISEAVSTQRWSGEAAVHVSIVNWVKGASSGRKRISFQAEDGSWRVAEVPVINSALSDRIDVSTAKSLEANSDSGACFQGQTHGHEGFVMPRADAETMIRQEPRLRDVLFPFLTADDLLTELNGCPTRYVIDFYPRDQFEAQRYEKPFHRVKTLVLPDRKAAANREAERTRSALADDSDARVNRHHANFLAKWWLMSYPRGELMAKLSTVARYIGCGQVTKRPIFEFIESGIHPNAALIAFPLQDDYSFGVLQSAFHWEWFKARCSTLEERFRYTSDTVFDSFPWPQEVTSSRAKTVAVAAVALRAKRRKIMARNRWSLRELYRAAELEGDNPIKDVQSALDDAVAAAYGTTAGTDALTFLLEVNRSCAAREAAGEAIVGPGLPPHIGDSKAFVSDDSVAMPRAQQ